MDGLTWIAVVVLSLSLIGITLAVCTDGYSDLVDWSGMIFLSTLVIAAVWFVLEIGLSSWLPHQNVHTRLDLAALRDNVSSQGTFFLGTGSVQGTLSYIYYLKQGNAYQFESLDASDVTVYEDTSKPYIVVSDSCKYSWDWLVGCNSGMPNTSDSKHDVIEIHVPKGTIKTNYVLNMGAAQ